MQYKNFPPAPPPSTTPIYCKYMQINDPSYFEQLLNTYVYIWTTDNQAFWIYPVYIDNNILYGYKWDALEWKTVQIPIENIVHIY